VGNESDGPGKGVPGRRSVGGEQAERVSAVPPGVSEPLVGVKDHEWEPTLSEVIPDREACLTAAYDYRFDVRWLA
jgi:hypothetical protein